MAATGGVYNTKLPVIKMSLLEMQDWLDNNVRANPERQKRLVLVIVSVALLLDNMLYMVIVPIIPLFFRETGVYPAFNDTKTGVFPNGTEWMRKFINYENEEEWNGFLFASKAMVQIMVGPFSGTIIDRIGYEIPMVIGLIVMFFSTLAFAVGNSYPVLFFARSLQGLGSAFADTAGLAMIADRFKEENERSKALGIAIAFISFGCLVAPPFGGTLYTWANGKFLPFIILSLVCLFDGFLVFMVIQPKRRVVDEGNEQKGTPIWRLFLDPYIAVCSGALIMANVSLAFIEPTISMWLEDEQPGITEQEIGMVWLPAFFPHVAGVYLTIVLMRKYPRHTYLLAGAGLFIEGVSCFGLPLTSSYSMVAFWLCTVCFGVALIDTSLLPMLGYLVDTRHVSVYGSVYAIADISYSLAYAFGPIVAGEIMGATNFTTLNMVICFSNLLYVPVLFFLRKVYVYKPFAEETLGGDGMGGGDAGQYDTLQSVTNEYYGKEYGTAADNETQRLATKDYGYGSSDYQGGFGIPGQFADNHPQPEYPGGQKPRGERVEQIEQRGGGRRAGGAAGGYQTSGPDLR